MGEKDVKARYDPGTETAPDPSAARRRLLVAATSAVGTAGLAGAAVPFIASMNPSERARVEGAPVDLDVSTLGPGERMTTVWRRKPVWILYRTEAMLNALTIPQHEARLADPLSRVTSQQPPYAEGELRSIKPQYLVVIPLCTHLGCIPTLRPETAPADLGPQWDGGFYCPCHGSKFDLAGRVYRNVPAPTNLVIPPYRFVSDTVIRIGEDAGQKSA